MAKRSSKRPAKPATPNKPTKTEAAKPKAAKEGKAAKPAATTAATAPKASPAQPAAQAAPTPKHANPGKPRTPRQSKPRAGGLTAAAELLAKTGKAMKCQEMVEALAKSGAWTPHGKTPAATLASAIIREIKTKGGQSRIKKVAPGTFAAAGSPTSSAPAPGPAAASGQRKGGGR